jgi:HD superfamily phosphodiesterase
MLTDQLITKMKEHFGTDKSRINHALQVTNFAEQLISNLDSDQLNEKVIIYAAILHDVGIKPAEAKYNSAAGKYQEQEGPPIAREIMASLNIEEAVINEVCQIIAHHHSPGVINTLNFRGLYDADWLVNLPDEQDLTQPRAQVTTIIDDLYFTDAAKHKARELFL